MATAVPRKLRARLSRGALVSAATLLALLLAGEGTLRLCGFGRHLALYFDPEIGYRYLPDQRRATSGETGEVMATVTIDALGYRGPAWTAPKRAGERRIACLGDSFTFGWGVEDDETWPHQLQGLLDQRAGGERWSVMNFAVPGYNTWNELRTYERVVRAHRPDVVVLGFYLNDVSPRPAGPRHSDRGPLRWFGRTALVEAFHRHVGRHVPYFHSGTSAAERALDDLYRERSTEIELGPASELGRPFWERALAELEELVRAVRADGVGLLVVGFPARYQLAPFERGDPAVRAPQAYLAEQAGRLGVPFLDLLPVFSSVAEASFGEQAASHPSGEGYRVCAEVILRELGARGLLDAMGR